MQKPCFITLEGVDGAGKSTHFEWMINTLESRGIDLIYTREPGGTELGEALRELLLHQSMQLKTETLLMFAARNEHWQQKIKPALADNKWVICDRFTDSTYAYQGGGRQLGLEQVAKLDNWLDLNAKPDFTFLFDLPLSVARTRLNKNRQLADRFEQEGEAFFKRTQAAYHNRMLADPDRFKLIDSQLSIAEVQTILALSLENLIVNYSDLSRTINNT